MHNNKAHLVLREKRAILHSIRSLSRWARKSAISIIKTLLSVSCERRIKSWLDSSSIGWQGKADIYYRQRSMFAQVKILDHLKSKLMRENVKAHF